MQTTKIVTMRIGMLGVDEEGLGTSVVQFDTTSADDVIARALVTGYRKAMLEAVKDLAPLVKARTDDS